MAAAYSEGRYWVRATSQAFGASRNKGTPEFALRFVVKGRVNPENQDGDLIRCGVNERTLYLYFTEGSAEYAIDDLARIGFDKSSLRFLDPSVQNFHSFAGTEFEAFCEHEEYQGQTKERWRIAKPRQPLQCDKPLDAADVRKLDTLFGKQLSKLGRGNVARQSSEPEPELVGVSDAQRNAAPKSSPNRPPTDSDIPFVWIGWLVGLTTLTSMWS